jgi:hypothetical protein
MAKTRRGSRRLRGALVLLAGIACALVMVVALLGVVVALFGGGFGCQGGEAAHGLSGPAPTRYARRAIPRPRLLIYRKAGARFSIDWTFLASIGAQECNHDGCAGDNGYGCAGPMQIAVRRGSPCSPGAGRTEWERYKVDGGGDGRTDIDDPADAVFTAARILRFDKGAPRAGGSYADYRQAACRYYGACADAAANYADEVMARAVAYGFIGPGAPTTSAAPIAAAPVPAVAAETTAGSQGCAGPGSEPVPGGRLGRVVKLYSPRRLAALSPGVIAAGFGAIRCDARIVADVEYLARRYRVRVTACYAIHTPDGEHPLGAATDLIPADGDWDHVLELARAIGWKPSCAQIGTAPECARPPFRFAAYNGYPGHGDPQHCRCAGGAHLHLSWLTSASPGQRENAARTTYFAPTWIEAFSLNSHPGNGSEGGS